MNDTLSWLVPLLVSAASGLVTFYSTQRIIQVKLDRLEEDMKDMTAQGRDLRDKVIACETILKERGPVVQSHSPLALTERGQAMLEESGGKEYLKKHLKELTEAIRKHKPKSAYDVQELAKETIEARTDSEEFTPMKDYLYLEGAALEELVQVLGIELRDEALPALGFNVAELDEKSSSDTKSEDQDLH
jgi:hypothetical protein